MGPREALLAVTAPRPAFFCPLPAESRRPRAPGQSETRRHGPLRPPGISAGVPGCRVPSRLPALPTLAHLGCPRLRGAGGRGGAPSGTRPPAPLSSLRLGSHGSGWTRLGGGGRRGRALRAERAPREGAGSCLGGWGLSSALRARCGESQLHNFILALPRGSPPPTPPPPPVIGSQRALGSPPRPLRLHSSKSLGVAAPAFTFSLPARRPGCVPPRAATRGVPAALPAGLRGEPLKGEEGIAPSPPGVWGKCFRGSSILF